MSTSQQRDSADDAPVKQQQQQQHDVSYDVIESNNNLAAAIRESTQLMIGAAGAPRTMIGIASGMGFLAFSIPNFVNGMWMLGIIGIPQSMANPGVQAAVLVAFVGQFLAGLWNFTKGDTFGGVIMSGYGLYWLLYGYFIQYAGPAMVTAALTPVAAGGAGYPLSATPQVLQLVNEFLGYMNIPWFIVTTIYLICALRMVLLEAWILTTVWCSYLCIIGVLFADNGSSNQTRWLQGLGIWSLLLSLTSLYFIAVILINSTYNHSVLPMGHSHPIIQSWPHKYGSAKHEETHRNLKMPFPVASLGEPNRGRSDEIYKVDELMRRQQMYKGTALPERKV